MLRRLVIALALAWTGAAPAAAEQAQTITHDHLAVAGSSVSIPVSTIAGAAQGPTLALIAGTHGYEYAPIIALHRILKRPELRLLRGTLVMVHVANTSSFYRRTIYYKPTDGVNLNRANHCDPAGTERQRIANAITTQVIEKADYLIDLHAGDGNEDLRPFTYLPEIGDQDLDRRSRGLAIAFGLDHIVIDRASAPDPVASRFSDLSGLSRGFPAFSTETGGVGSCVELWVSLGVMGMMFVMRHLDMLPGDAVLRDDIVWLEDYQVVTSPGRGLFRPEVRSGYAIAENGRLGVLVDEFGAELSVVRAPFAGIVNYVVATPPVSTGEPVAMISRIATE